MSWITLLKRAAPPSPPAGKVSFFVATDGSPKYVDENGTVGDFRGPTGATGATGPTGATGAAGTNGTNGADRLRASNTAVVASTANSTAVAVLASLTIPANAPVAGRAFDFAVEGTQSQSAAAVNVVFAVRVNGTAIATATIAGGTAAQTNRALSAFGAVSFVAVGASGSVVGGITQIVTGLAANSATNVAGVAVNTTNAVTLDVVANVSVANAANIIRAATAYIREV